MSNISVWQKTIQYQKMNLPKIRLIPVRLIDRKVLISIYPAMNSSLFSSVTTVFGQPLVYTFLPSFIPNMILLKGFHIHVSL